jgi:hypothetical protein
MDQCKALLDSRRHFREVCNFVEADRIRGELELLAWSVIDGADGSSTLVPYIPTEMAARVRAEAQKSAQGQRRVEKREAVLARSLRSPLARSSTSSETPGDGRALAIEFELRSGRSRQQLRSRLRAKQKLTRGPDFANWLVDTFGLDSLRGAGTSGAQNAVLDVAGGRGDLAWALCVHHAVATTVVDPMPLRLSAAKTKFLLKQAKIRIGTDELSSVALDRATSGIGGALNGCSESPWEEHALMPYFADSVITSLVES